MDVNLLVYAWDRRAPLHERAVLWLDTKLSESARVGGHESPHLRKACLGERGVGAGGALAERPQCVGAARGESPPGDTGTLSDPAGWWGETDSRRASGSACDRARTGPLLHRRRFCAIRRSAMGKPVDPLIRPDGSPVFDSNSPARLRMAEFISAGSPRPKGRAMPPAARTCR